MSASSKKKLRKEQAAEMMTEKQLQEQKEAKKLKAYTLTFAIVMILVVCIAVGTIASQLVNNSGIIQKSTTAVTIGNHKLNTAFLSYFYVDNINDNYTTWNNNFGDYTSYYLKLMYGLDLSQPLNKQHYDTEGKVTWADYFANEAIDMAKNVYTMYDLAVEAGHTLSDEEKASLESSIQTTEFYAMLYGYKDLESYLKGVYGKGSEVSTYREYLEHSMLANSYYNAYSESLTYKPEDLKAYNDEHFNEFSSFNFASFYMNVSDFLTGGTKGEDGNTTYSDEDQKNAAVAAADAAEQLKKAGIKDAAGLDKALKALEAYKDNNAVTSSKNEDVMYGNIGTSIVEWIADASRKPGDFTVIPNESTSKDADGKETTTVLGYYAVVFESRNDNTFNLINARHILAAFEGGTTDKDGKTVYTETEKKKAEDAINKVMDTWRAGEKTEESFIALVKDNTDDEDSAENGGLYENIFPGQMVTAFEDWCYDASRKPGNVDIIETEYGYHMMYFVGESDTTYRNYMIEATLRNEDVNEWFDAALKDTKVDNIKTKYLDLDFIIAPNI